MFDALLTQLLTDTTQTSLRLLAPELALSVGIVLLLLARLFEFDRWIVPSWIALWATLAAFMLSWSAFLEFTRSAPGTVPYFTGLMVMDQFAITYRLGMSLFLILMVALTVLTGIPDREDSPDFYALLLGSAVGMLLMGSANHLLMMFLSFEMSSVPGYVLVGFLKGRRQSSEAALKYVVYGSGAAGIMLYGISLLAGLLGTAEFPQIAQHLQSLFMASPATLSDPAARLFLMAFLMIMVGMAFKLSVVPFHLWAPDAFHGASAEVGAFVSVASKAAAFVLLIRFVLSLVTPSASLGLQEFYGVFAVGLGLLAALTATFGNLAAYGQKNIKRLLGYSTIAQGGYMLMAVAALMALRSSVEPGTTLPDERSARAIEGLLYYLAVYLFMNLGAFAITALVRNELLSEEIEDWAGVGQTSPILGIGMATCFFGLIGLPPLGGFVAKLFVFASVLDAGFLYPAFWGVFAVGAINTVISVFYYVRVLKVMFLQTRPAGAIPVRIGVWSNAGIFVWLVIVPQIIPLGLAGHVVSGVARRAADSLLNRW